jgi:hypothetical protein
VRGVRFAVAERRGMTTGDNSRDTGSLLDLMENMVRSTRCLKQFIVAVWPNAGEADLVKVVLRTQQ